MCDNCFKIINVSKQRARQLSNTVFSEKGAVAQPPKGKTEVKAKKGFTTSVFCFKFNSCEQKNSKARIVYRNFGKKSTIKISDADRNKNIEAQRALSGKHPA